MKFFKTVPASLTESKPIDWSKMRNKQFGSQYNALAVIDGKIETLGIFKSVWRGQTCHSFLQLRTAEGLVATYANAGGYGYDKALSNLYSCLRQFGFETNESAQYDFHNVATALATEFYAVDNVYVVSSHQN